jgi:tetratricopeptide (TPR) repeat protein
LSPDEATQKLATGWALFDEVPRTLERVRLAAGHLRVAAENLPDNADAHIKAARALAYLSEHETAVDKRKQAAQQGIAMARRARELQPDRVEGHYWYALNVGLLADVDRDYGLDAVGEMVAALKIACDIGAAYENAGPLRLLGLLHLRAPPAPVSVGSKRKAQQLFQRAVEACPQFPENYLYLGEAQRDLHRPDDARASLQKVLDLPVPAGHETEATQWRARAQELLRELDERR